MVEHACHHEVHKIRDLLRSMIKSRCSGHYYRARARESEHVAEVDRTQRSLTWDQNQPSLLFQRDIGRSLDQRSAPTIAQMFDSFRVTPAAAQPPATPVPPPSH